MNKIAYKIYQNNNELRLFDSSVQQKLYSSFWFMEFGKTASEIKGKKEELVYEITKKFEFWKWRLVYYIKEPHCEQKLCLIAQNTRNTIFQIDIENSVYEIRIGYKKKKSVYKNKQKIAEFDTSCLDNDFIELLLADKKELKIVFLLLACIFIGETDINSKTGLKSQKTLEKNEDPWF